MVNAIFAFVQETQAERAPAASPRTTSPTKDSDKDGKPDSADKAPTDPTKK